MKYIRLSAIFVSVFFVFLLLGKDVQASEGFVELESVTGDSYRCYASSIQMQDLKYNVSVTCRDLLYPAGDDIFNYILWVTKVSDGKPAKLGSLGLGRASFRTSVSFSNMFVTTEANAKTKEPKGTTVMRGDVQPITFLEEPTRTEEVKEEEKAPSETTPSATPTTLSTRDRLVAGLKRAALVSLLALLALVGLVFVLTRKR